MSQTVFEREINECRDPYHSGVQPRLCVPDRAADEEETIAQVNDIRKNNTKNPCRPRA
ncbi:MAG: hypothetical protein ACI8XM_000002 [Haloarculaceae archaeon]|jgi:hypothetical protein